MKRILALLLFVAAVALAQDTRHVTEPHIPSACTTLNANGATEAKLDTDRIQAALDNCESGKAVVLRGGEFVTGPLELRRSVTLVVDRGATLFGSRDAKVYDKGSGTCGTVTQKDSRGCRPLIHVTARDAGVMGDGIIDGRGGEKLAGKNLSWWDLAHEAKITKAHQNCPRTIIAEKADNFTLYRITLKDSPNFHVTVMQTNGFTAWGVKIDSPKTARNTDGIDPSSSTNVSILHCDIHAGDDNVAIKAGSNGPSAHITVAHCHFSTGHGMSIGSETNGGVEDVDVHDLTIDGADNGLRIKSNSTRGGVVRNVTYRDVCIRNTKEPIVIDPFYSTKRGTLVPRFEDITFANVHITTPGRITIAGADAAHRTRVRFDGVRVDGFEPKLLRAAHLRIGIGPAGVNFTPAGEDVEIVRDAASADAAGRTREDPCRP